MDDGRDGGGPTEAAARWHGHAAQEPTTYYGQLSARRLGQTIDITLPAAIDPDLEVRAEFGASELVYVIRLLGELGQRKVQQRFLHHLRQSARSASDFQLIAELAQAQGRPDIALRTAKDARLAGFTLPDLLYPKFEPQHADGLDPALMLALDYEVTDRLLFGSDWPLQTTQEAVDAFRAINDWGEGVTLPRFPDEIIEDILHNRPLELIWPDG